MMRPMMRQKRSRRTAAPPQCAVPERAFSREGRPVSALPALEPGVPRALAARRLARYRDVRYALALAIDPREGRVRGTVEIEVALPAACALVLDWRGDAEYVYSLFVPADACALFACFDQPDLKARFRLWLAVPPGWTAVSCAPVVDADAGRFVFAETPPLPTCAFAFAAGPFATFDDPLAEVAARLYVRRSQRQRASADADAALRLARDGLAWHAAYLAHARPSTSGSLSLLLRERTGASTGESP
jgi:hypothetical protein